MSAHQNPRRVLLGLGSNLGDRLACLQRALNALAALPGISVIAISGVYETAPVGGPPQGDFLNAVVAIRTSLPARTILGITQSLEHEAGRAAVTEREHWGPRPLDVDILIIEGESIDEVDLQVPHPRISSRAFVLVPLLEVAPELEGTLVAPADFSFDDPARSAGVVRAGVALVLPKK